MGVAHIKLGGYVLYYIFMVMKNTYSITTGEQDVHIHTYSKPRKDKQKQVLSLFWCHQFLSFWGLLYPSFCSEFSCNFRQNPPKSARDLAVFAPDENTMKFVSPGHVKYAQEYAETRLKHQHMWSLTSYIERFKIWYMMHVISPMQMGDWTKKYV